MHSAPSVPGWSTLRPARIPVGGCTKPRTSCPCISVRHIRKWQNRPRERAGLLLETRQRPLIHLPRWALAMPCCLGSSPPALPITYWAGLATWCRDSRRALLTIFTTTYDYGAVFTGSNNAGPINPFGLAGTSSSSALQQYDPPDYWTCDSKNLRGPQNGFEGDRGQTPGSRGHVSPTGLLARFVGFASCDSPEIKAHPERCEGREFRAVPVSGELELPSGRLLV